MKTLIFALLLASTSMAETFTLIDQSTVTGDIRRVEPDGIVLFTDSGISKVKFTELPTNVASQYGYDPSKAEKFKADQVTAAVALQNEIKAKKNWEENKKKAEEMVVWGSQNEFEGSVVYSTIYVGGGFIGDSHANVGGGGNGFYSQGIARPNYKKPLYVQNLKNLAQGESKTIKAFRDGTITIGSTSYEKWVWVPEGL